jgi:hypothetical protein
MNALFAGGGLKNWSIPVAEARAVVGVVHAIDSDDDEKDETINPGKRGRSDTGTIMLPKKKSNADMMWGTLGQEVSKYIIRVTR